MTERTPPVLPPGASSEQQKASARAWFAELRDRICTAFEEIEDESAVPDRAAGRFTRSAWQRPGGGGGVMAVMRGRVFEKVGVNVSTVHGDISPEMRGALPGAAEDRRPQEGSREVPGASRPRASTPVQGSVCAG